MYESSVRSVPSQRPDANNNKEPNEISGRCVRGRPTHVLTSCSHGIHIVQCVRGVGGVVHVRNREHFRKSAARLPNYNQQFKKQTVHLLCNSYQFFSWIIS